jgi:hypothetical protein
VLHTLNTLFRRLVATLLIAATGLTAVPVQAAMLAAVAGTAAADRDRISAVLEREDVRAQLAARGVSPEQARARVAALSDAEAAELAARIDELPAGGIGVLGAALVVFLVLLLTDILGYTKIFPFTRPARN